MWHVSIDRYYISIIAIIGLRLTSRNECLSMKLIDNEHATFKLEYINIEIYFYIIF